MEGMPAIAGIKIRFVQVFQILPETEYNFSRGRGALGMNFFPMITVLPTIAIWLIINTLILTRMHSSRMRNACYSDSGGGLLTEMHPRQRPSPPLEGTWDQAANQEVASYRDHPVDRMTDASENITLPQTSFAGGNKTIACECQ